MFNFEKKSVEKIEREKCELNFEKKIYEQSLEKKVIFFGIYTGIGAILM